MTPNGSSLVSRARQFGPDDRVFNALLAVGPVLVVGLAVLGRSPFSQALVGLYLLALVARTAQNAVPTDGG